MTNVIADEIKKYTKNVWTNSSFGPDVVFQIEKDGKIETYAIEVETGTQVRKNREMEEKAKKNDSLEKYKEWWFVVMDKDLKEKYGKMHEAVTRGEVREKIKGLFK